MLDMFTVYQLGDIEVTVVSGVGSVLGTILGHYLSVLVIVLLQSLVSGYCMMRGLSLGLGGFPSETSILTDIYSNKMDEKFGGAVIAYLLFLTIATCASLKYQFKRAMNVERMNRRMMGPD